MKAKKWLSQNFLTDASAVKRLVELADVGPDDVILEIGPGRGAITKELLKAGATVVAVEKDRELARNLKQHPNLHVIPDDILDISLEEALRPHLKNGEKAKVVANLPFQVTTPIVTRLVQAHTLFSRLTLIIQREVARRFAASPRSRDYGSITIYLQAHSDLELAFEIPRSSFSPQPKVDAAVIDVVPKPPLVIDEAFFAFVRLAFSKRRKMLRGTLSPRDAIEETLLSLGLPETARPEELSLNQFLALYSANPASKRRAASR